MFHNYGIGGKHSSKREPPTARQARRLEKKKTKKIKLKPLYGWEGEVICEQIVFDKPSQITYEGLEKALEYFEKYSALAQR